RAATLLGPKALEQGIAAAVSRNHGHIGAAGVFSGKTLEQGGFCFVTTRHQLNLQPGYWMQSAGGGAPISSAFPTGDEPPFVLDFGAMHDLYGNVEEIMKIAPSTVVRSLGLGCVCQALGGFLCGVPVDPKRAKRQWEGANQGSFMIAVDINRF